MAGFGRLITAMVTPFKDDMSIDFDKTAKLALYLLKNGSDAILLHGTTGESPTLSHDEEYELYRVVKKVVGTKCKVIAGTGSNSTATSVKSTIEAEKIGVDGAMIVVPYYNKPSQEGLYQHFKAIADNTKLPLIIYNIPGRTGINMLPETVARISKIKNYVGLKDAAGNIDQTSAVINLCPPDFVVWSGDDSLTLPMMSVGAVGVISVASHVVGNEIASMIAAYHSGNNKKAKEIHLRLLPIFKALFITANPTPVKAALEMIGMSVGIPRLPLISVNKQEKEIIKKALTGLGLIK
ncbi:4-hydroxy-tetrahydrodipicolinate synthase [candidate division WOR-1 bacterium RIFOXYA2_FULL_36_21]|uniref:4-hydroxy-tetrahydrodipicolinate synthase n=1 Tax=candidate division WOR-1 bacterium RIFOXYB2_FULL_36_35 TaxID=1802578 RepID=A0A1F4S350_UNCSA|nr:MAG: 4-hydroxy-tetrahydrodipicolinate synthase [candidate division WOR-1 bacterium RIFOXYA2_FULL_36_21]OGC14163.1 MAG: 4-hydroxy-tetrahydrodipicolinate synthase [candidate division WOR-1 bacterium RIFOXYB2_FULL_36_35]OGC15385.1 MAG: 4-hydroxy-tetrahydrodipicolinate synthase [candidate division WOR-1 bacterium RIFOXYA12_FULL_36_13]